MKEKLIPRKPRFLFAAAGLAGVVALSGCSPVEAHPLIDNLEAVSITRTDDAVHFGITGVARDGSDEAKLTSHMELSCNDNGVKPPIVVIHARTLVGEYQRFETERQVSSKIELPCDDYLEQFGKAAALDDFSGSFENSNRELFGDGRLVLGDVDEFAAKLLADALAGNSVK